MDEEQGTTGENTAAPRQRRHFLGTSEQRRILPSQRSTGHFACWSRGFSRCHEHGKPRDGRKHCSGSPCYDRVASDFQCRRCSGSKRKSCWRWRRFTSHHSCCLHRQRRPWECPPPGVAGSLIAPSDANAMELDEEPTFFPSLDGAEFGMVKGDQNTPPFRPPTGARSR